MDIMPKEMEGLSHTEYLIVFNTVLFGVIASEFFSGWGSMLRYRETVKIYWPHFFFTIFAFLTFIQNWYGIWPRTRFINDNILFFFYSLVPMFVYHLLTVALFPSMKKNDKVDFKEYYFKNSRLLFIIFAIYFATTISSSYIYVDQGNVLVQNIIRLCGVLMSIAAAYWYRSIILHIIFLVIGYGGLIGFIWAIPT